MGRGLLGKGRVDYPIVRYAGMFLVCTVVVAGFVAVVLSCVAVVAALLKFISWAVGS